MTWFDCNDMANTKCWYTEPSFPIQSNTISTTNVTFPPEALEYFKDCFLELSDFTFAHNKERFSNADRHLVCILLQNRCTYRLRFCDFTQRLLLEWRSKGKHRVKTKALRLILFSSNYPLDAHAVHGSSPEESTEVFFLWLRGKNYHWALRLSQSTKNYLPRKSMIIFVPKKDFLSGLYIRFSPL